MAYPTQLCLGSSHDIGLECLSGLIGEKLKGSVDDVSAQKISNCGGIDRVCCPDILGHHRNGFVQSAASVLGESLLDLRIRNLSRLVNPRRSRLGDHCDAFRKRTGICVCYICVANS